MNETRRFTNMVLLMVISQIVLSCAHQAKTADTNFDRVVTPKFEIPEDEVARFCIATEFQDKVARFTSLALLPGCTGLDSYEYSKLTFVSGLVSITYGSYMAGRGWLAASEYRNSKDKKNAELALDVEKIRIENMGKLDELRMKAMERNYKTSCINSEFLNSVYIKGQTCALLHTLRDKESFVRGFREAYVSMKLPDISSIEEKAQEIYYKKVSPEYINTVKSAAAAVTEATSAK